MADLLPPGQWQVCRASDVCGGKKDLAMAWPRCQCGGTSNAQVGHYFFDVWFFLDGYPSSHFSRPNCRFLDVFSCFWIIFTWTYRRIWLSSGERREAVGAVGVSIFRKVSIFHGEPVGATDCCRAISRLKVVTIEEFDHVADLQDFTVQTSAMQGLFIYIIYIYILDDIGSNGFHCTGLQVWLRFRSPPLAQVVESYFC